MDRNRGSDDVEADAAASSDSDGRSKHGDVVIGRAEARRAASAGFADLAERQADAVAILDRAFEARLGEFDRAFASRRSHLESRLQEAGAALAEVIDAGMAEFKRAAGEERRLLKEGAAAELAGLERAVDARLRELDEAAEDREQLLQTLLEHVRDLERGRVRDLD